MMNMESVLSSLIESESMADVTLYCYNEEGGKAESLRSHRLLLSTCSDYFLRILSETATTTSNPSVIIPDVSSSIMKRILKFIYSGEVRVSPDQIDDLIEAAEMMEIRGLSKETVVPIDRLENKRKLRSPRHLKLNDDEPKDFSQKISQMEETAGGGGGGPPPSHDKEAAVPSEHQRLESSESLEPLPKKRAPSMPVSAKMDSDTYNPPDGVQWNNCEMPNSDFPHYMVAAAAVAAVKTQAYGSETTEVPESNTLAQPAFQAAPAAPAAPPPPPVHNVDQQGNLNISDINNILNTVSLPLCPICGKDCANFPNLRTHLHTHNSLKPFACDFCEAKFSRASHLNRHRRTHTGEKPFECTKCGKLFSRQDKLKTHLDRHFIKEQKSNPPQAANTNNAEPPTMASWNSSTAAFPSQVAPFPPYYALQKSQNSNLMNYLKCQK